MNPLSPNHFFNSPEERLFQNEEDSQQATTQKSSQVAQAVFSSPFQSIEDRALSHSWDVPDSPLSPSDIPLEDASYYEQGAFSLADLSDDKPTGYKRLGPPIEAPPLKRLHLSELEGFQDSNPISNEQQIASVLRPFEDEPQSIPQLDGFSQMVNTWEVLEPSRGEGWMGESSQSLLDSDEEFIQFIQKETVQIEANADFQESVDRSEKEADEEIEKRLSLLETIGTSSHLERTQIQGIEKFDEKKITPQDQYILHAIHKSRGLLAARALTKELNKKNVMVNERQVKHIFQKFDLSTEEKRIAAHDAGWLRFNVPPFPSVPLYFKRDKIDDPTTQETVVRLACKNPELNYGQIIARLEEQHIFISTSTVKRILTEKKLSTRKLRQEAAKALPRQDQTLSDSLKLSEKRIGESPLDSDEEFIQFLQNESVQIETNVGLQESAAGNTKEADEERFSLLETVGTDSDIERPQIEEIEKFDEKTISLRDQYILNALYDSRGLLGPKALVEKLNKKNVIVTENQISNTFKKYDLNSSEKRKVAHAAGWPRFKALPFPIAPGSKKLIPLPSKRVKIDDSIRNAVARLACENPELDCVQIAARLKEQHIFISDSSVFRILSTKKLSTLKQRRAANALLE